MTTFILKKMICFKQGITYQIFVSIILVAVFIVAIASHVVFSAGLNHDGADVLTYMIFDNSFHFFETSRLFFHALYQIPAWLFIKFSSSNSLSLLTMIFCFGLVWIHIVSLAGCWLILPKDKKNIIFFPLFAFLVGPLTALDHAISVSLSVFSYVWFTAFTIYYSDLSLNKHKILFALVPLPLLLSHELMSYASLFLIFLCFLKKNYQKDSINKALVRSLILFFAVTFFIAIYFIVFPSSVGNRDQFLSRLLDLEFIYNIHHGYMYSYVVLALLLMIVPFFQMLKPVFLRWPFLFSACLISLIINVLLLAPNSEFLNQFLSHDFPVTYNRVWVFTVLPFTLFLWFLFEKQIFRFQSQKLFLTLCLVSSIALMKWRVQMDTHFYKFQKQFSENLKSYKGVFENKIFEQMSFSPKKLSYFYPPYLPMSATLIFPRSHKIETIILNSPRADCFNSCKNRRNWHKIRFAYDFASKEEHLSYCKEECSFHTNYFLINKILNTETRFFDFTALRKHLKKQERGGQVIRMRFKNSRKIFMNVQPL